MAKFQSFDEQKRKFQKIWEQNQSNLSNITENIKKVNVDYEAQTALKNINIVTLMDDELLPSSNFGQFQFIFANFPDWAVNFATPMIFMRFDSAWNVADEKVFVVGDVEVNDITILDPDIETWWTKIDNSWRFNVLFSVNPRFASSVSEFGFSTTSLPTFATVKLYMINERNYNIIQSGK